MQNNIVQPGDVESNQAGVSLTSLNMNARATYLRDRNPVHGFSKMRTFELLPREAWEDVDSIVKMVAKQNLVGIADLEALGLSFPYDGMASSVYTRKRTSKVGEATINRTPDPNSFTGQLAMSDLSVPMYVTYKDFYVNTSTMAQANRAQFPLSIALIEEATQSVARKLEEVLFTGEVEASGHKAYGYTTYPDRVKYDFAHAAAWSITNPEYIVEDVNGMMTASAGDNNHFGPWMLYVPWSYNTLMNLDYVTDGTSRFPVSGSIRNRLMELPDLIGIRPTHFLPDDNVVLVEMSSNTIQLIDAMPIRAVAWEPIGTPNWDHRFKVLAMKIPYCQSDYEGNCGIIHGMITHP